MKSNTTPLADLSEAQIERLKERLEALLENPIKLALENTVHIWQKAAYANRIAQIRALPGMEPYVDAVLSEALLRCSLVLSPTLSSDKRDLLVETALDNVTRVFGKRISITGVLHCLDLIINAQAPFNREIYRFEVRTLSVLLQVYLTEQAERMRQLEEKPLGAAQRAYLLAKAVGQKPEVAASFKALQQKLSAKEETYIEQQRATLPKYLNIPDYLFKSGYDVDRYREKIRRHCEAKEINLTNFCFAALEQVNYGGHSPMLQAIIDQ